MLHCTIPKQYNIYRLNEIGQLINPQNIAFIDTIYGSHEKIYGYHLKDSTIFYYGKGGNFYFNQDNISNTTVGPYTIHATQSENKTLEIKGIETNRKYWKHKVIGKYFIGYTLAPIKQRGVLDKIIKQTKSIIDF